MAMKCLPYEGMKRKSPVEENRYYWYNKDSKKHSFNDQPAVRYPNGYKAYYKEDEWHRDYGKPARIYEDGTKAYYKEGWRYYPEITQRVD